MNVKNLIVAAAVFAAAGSAFAADATGNFFDFATPASTQTRADVKAEAQTYRATHPKFVAPYGAYDVFSSYKGQLTRAEVKAATQQAGREGQLGNAEFFDTARLTAQAPARAEGFQSARN